MAGANIITKKLYRRREFVRSKSSSRQSTEGRILYGCGQCVGGSSATKKSKQQQGRERKRNSASNNNGNSNGKSRTVVAVVNQWRGCVVD